MEPLNVRVNHQASGDDYFGRQLAPSEHTSALATVSTHPMDGPEAREELKKLLEWYYYEKDRQAINRLEMAMDADFYDGLQWNQDDAADVTDRGQMPLVFNEVAPMIDWIIGTERRAKVDWSVMPRSEDDVDMADVKPREEQG